MTAQRRGGGALPDDELGSRLRAIRRRVGMTQEQLAEASGLSVDGIGALERGHRRRPRHDTIELLTKALGISEDEAAQLRALSRPDSSATATESEAKRPRRRVSAPLSPHQLPAPPTTYIGRDAAVDDLVHLLTRTERLPTPRVATITGMGGVGKTGLALLVAHRAAAHYPDGQLYLNLRANGGTEPLTLQSAMTFLLTSLGMHADDVPTDLAQATAAFRTRTSSTRLLLVFDNVAQAGQVESLLPGGPANAVLITSRSTLGAAIDARPCPLEPLPRPAARQLLAAVVGEQRVAADPLSSRAVIESCAGLPLALRIVAARMQARPNWAMSDLAHRLSDRDGRLAELNSGGVAVAATLAGSLDQLRASEDPVDQDAARAWLAMGVLPASLLPPTAIEAVCEWTAARTRLAIERLLEVSLIEEPLPGTFRMHDLVHALARATAQQELSPADQHVWRTRALERYVAVAWRSLVLSRAAPEGFDEAALTAGIAPDLTPKDCLDLITQEAEQILALAGDVVRHDSDSAIRAAHVALGLMTFFVARVDSAGWSELLSLVLDHVPEDAHDVRIWLHQDLAFAHSGRGEHEVALTHAHAAAELARAAGRVAAEAAACNVTAIALRRLDRMPEALDACRRGLALCEQAGDERALAIAWRDTGQLQSQCGDLVDGIASERKSLAIYRRIGVPRGVAMTLINVGVMLRKNGDLDEALTHLTEAVEVSRSVGDLALETEALDELGYWHLLAGDALSGIHVLQDGLAVLADSGSGQWEPSIRHRLGLALDSLGRYDEADAQWLAAVRLHEQRGEVRRALELRQQWQERHRLRTAVERPPGSPRRSTG